MVPVFQVIGGGGNEKVSPSGARRENLGVFCVKNQDFYAKNHIFSNIRGVPVVKSTKSHMQ